MIAGLENMIGNMTETTENEIDILIVHATMVQGVTEGHALVQGIGQEIMIGIGTVIYALNFCHICLSIYILFICVSLASASKS